jgi:hypothetical protein
MVTYAHKKLISEIHKVDEPPADQNTFLEWIKAGAHLSFLERNAVSDERLIYASGPYMYVHTIAVPLELLSSSSLNGLLGWNADPFGSIASYVSGGGRDTMWIERGTRNRGSPALDNGIDLVFSRTFEGWTGPGRNYVEINQEYTHLAGIHWRPEHSAYCRFDANGDLDEIVSVTTHERDGDVTLVTFTWPELEEYLAIAGLGLVRMFDFTLLRYGSSSSWGDGPEQIIRRSDDVIYRQKIAGNAAYTRGVQIMRPRDARTVSDEIADRWSGGRTNKQHVSFLAQDLRHGDEVVEISTDPSATTNYFEAGNNDLPFELSPAFFRPEVLSKYKTDREKYTVEDREVTCRTAWSLRAYDVNDAGQVFAYVCYLRNLPYSELLHWKSYNEAPKAGISERAFINDFKGEFVTFQHPRAELLSILTNWQRRKVAWWTLSDEDLVGRANPPISSSKDEWGEAVMDLSKLVVEGFVTKSIRAQLDTKGVHYDAKEQSIALLEKLLGAANPVGGPVRLEGLRTVQFIRSKVKGHSGSTEGRALAREAIEKHGSYAGHFKTLCAAVVDDLRTIEGAF